MNIYPYVYRVDHPSGEFYIGYRAANRVPALADFGIKYKTSTKLLSYPFEEYAQTILAEFYLPSGATDAYDFEQALIYENLDNPLMVNERCYYSSKARFSRTGKTHSNESKAKMSLAKRGKVIKPHSAEHKQKISEAQRGKPRKPLSAASRQKISEAHRGKTHSAETKLKISEAGRGRKHSAETKAKMSERTHSVETKLKIAASLREKARRS